MNALARALPLVALVGVCFAPRGVAAPARDGDPLLVGTAWKGKLTQKGGGPTDFDCEFTVTKRDAETFEAELREKSDTIEVTYVVKGTVRPVDPRNRAKGYKVRFESLDAKDLRNTSAILKVPYAGTLVGKTLKGTWKLPPDSEFGMLEGDFTFERGKKKE
jgi:hypothetical protein